MSLPMPTIDWIAFPIVVLCLAVTGIVGGLCWRSWNKRNRASATELRG
jgi:hypothetical protein